MKTEPSLPSSRLSFPTLLASAWLCTLVLAGLPGCSRPANRIVETSALPKPAAIILAPHGGDERVDSEIRRMQDQVRTGQDVNHALERLGWLFITKARRSFDPGFYRLAEQCALGLEERQVGSPEALLLRGHACHNLHRFREAESLARQLTEARGLPFDFGLLSDVLMEQGKLDEAIVACQKMIDLRPDLQSYARGAHLRWLRGDLAGAERLMRLAAGAASPRDPESAAWAYSRLGLYQFQAGGLGEADQSCAEALEFQTNYPPALLLRGRLGLAQGEPAKAVESLRRAVQINPLPDYQWTLAEALRAAGRDDEAQEVETMLTRRAATSDPRTCSLFLATRGQQSELAVRLARAELELRQDIFSHDALAWALASAGQIDEALRESNLALAEGTRDGRLRFHAAVIAWKAGHSELAAARLRDAQALKAMLLPSEARQLSRLSAEVATSRLEAEPLLAARGPYALPGNEECGERWRRGPSPLSGHQ